MSSRLAKAKTSSFFQVLPSAVGEEGLSVGKEVP